jgi:ABC-type transport system involved in cytochrome c biogenesis permease component
MTVFPVIVRELRAQARQPLTYWLRVLAAGAVLGMFGFLLLLMSRSEEMWAVTSTGTGGINPFSGFGTLLFGYLNSTLFVCNCLLAPLLTADCISREKREGTLGLLFLTKLNAAGIVIGKAFVHTLRGLAMFAATLPVLAIPVLLGGISGKDCVMALLIDGIVLTLGLAAGFLASAMSRDWIRSFVLAEFLSVFLAFLFIYGHFKLFTVLISPTDAVYDGQSLLDQFIDLFWFHTNFAEPSPYTGRGPFGLQTTWSDIWATVPNVQTEWFMLIATCLAAASLFFVFAIAFAARRIRLSWRQEPTSRKVTALQRSLTAPRFAVQLLRRRLSRSLDRNPIGWLQNYSWAGRITKWGWFAVIMAFESLVISDVRNFSDVQPLIILLFLAGIAFTASASFRKDRDSGALELLLVCPLSVSQIIGGRLRGIWTQFLPSAALLALCVRIGADIEMRESDTRLIWSLLFPAFVTLPLIGLFFSMTRMNFLFAWLLTVLLGIVMPWVIIVISRLVWRVLLDITPDFEMLFLQLVLGTVFCRLLYNRLKNRRFAFAHT